MRRIFVVTTVSALVLAGEAAVRFAAPFADNMVLQRGMRVPVWGRADAGEQVRAGFAGRDGVFHPATVANRRIGGDIIPERDLIVACDKVREPARLRYLYSTPFTGSLYSGDSGLPLGPFEIDAEVK